MILAKSTMFVLVLLYAAYYDYKYRIIPDKVHIIILILGVINMNVLDSFSGLIVITLPVLIIGIMRGGIGGGDVKLMGASSFFLGVSGGLYGTVLGLLMAIVISGIDCLIHGKKVNRMPLAPYMALGYMMMLL
jgi:leader peptidase (prepilin peptidase)/N-methyltransferase